MARRNKPISRPTQGEVNTNKSRAIATTTPSPVLGLDSINDLVSMDERAAVTLDNFVVRPYGCETRKGSLKWATNFPNKVYSLMPYQAKTVGTSKLFASTATNIYEITSTTASPTSVVSSMTNGKWEYANITIPGGQYLVAVNGDDLPRLYNGTTWSAFSVVASPSGVGQISTASSIDPALWNNVTYHKLRFWAVEKNSTRAWYLPVNSLGGTATQFDFGNYMSRGGYLVALATWTLDSGYGLDDLFVAITSEGEMLIYQGSDPSSSTDWSLKGIYRVAPPLGKKCVIKYAGDLLYLSADGLVPLSSYLLTDGIDTSKHLTDHINEQIYRYSTEYASTYGWQVIHYQPENVIILNIPVLNGTIQYVFNTITKAWSRFTGWDANHFAIYNSKLYFASATTVVQTFTGYSDLTDSSGLNGTMYQAKAQQAFNSFEKLGQKKQFHMCRVITTSASKPKIYTGLTVDYNMNATASLTSSSSTTTQGSTWNSALWNNGTWAIDKSTSREWTKLYGLGIAASLNLTINVTDKVTWVATDWIYELGGVF